MKLDKSFLLLYVVTDRSWLGGNFLENQVEEIIKSGATFIQLREKNMSFDEFVAEGKKIKTITDKYKIPFVINDNIDVALAVDADGIHVGQNDMNAKDIRKLIAKDKLLGVSVQTVEQALIAERQCADYLGVGAIFSTSTKDDADSVSLETLKEICDAVSIPVVAIGGINESNILQLTGTGIDGVAVISAIFAKPDISAATRTLKSLAKKTVFKGMIFDLDGTILDSMSAWDNIGEEYLIRKGVKNISDDLNEKLKVMSLTDAAEYFIKEFGIERSVQEIIDDISLMIEDKYKYDIQLKKGVREFLEKNRNVKMCIATSSYGNLGKAALKRLGVDKYFDFMITSTETGSSKDSPDIFLVAAKRLELEPGEIVVFEDAPHAVVAAKSAGFYVVGVGEDSFADEKEEIIKAADLFVENILDYEVK